MFFFICVFFIFLLVKLLHLFFVKTWTENIHFWLILHKFTSFLELNSFKKIPRFFVSCRQKQLPHLHRLYGSSSSQLPEELHGFARRHGNGEPKQQTGGDWGKTRAWRRRDGASGLTSEQGLGSHSERIVPDLHSSWKRRTADVIADLTHSSFKIKLHLSKVNEQNRKSLNSLIICTFCPKTFFFQTFSNYFSAFSPIFSSDNFRYK